MTGRCDHDDLLGKLECLTTEAGDLRRHRDELAAEAAKGEKFKLFVHSYLDAHGVPAGDPDNQHQKEGCRIGARLDLMFAERDLLRSACQEALDAIPPEWYGPDGCSLAKMLVAALGAAKE